MAKINVIKMFHTATLFNIKQAGQISVNTISSI